ncbi:DUF7089 family protein [Halalkalicoccus jeotgali]|uniref:Uncharacterized protein n=1 Tax=Halalkalicoccus jeotgali (strain DSM 18796 / CECT 7217 / JCM 14584 / KCTC 4019 / B3) TaxID=795797 RepID=D8J4F9_HALJB|nr:hypothetical protein [Halalkalicoccus jeotgali]ADJ13521.1 hypothetical protein HacjB3_00640 [Halalkalicoccus jeotgali B3]ELY33004.1 hypothetical protein C497_18692 [Halalkalicoccus jeotgali B3]
MFAERPLSPALSRVREEHAPGTLVVDCESDFETLPPEALDDLAVITEEITPVSHSDEWVPEDAPAIPRRYVGSDLVVVTPGAGSVAWTTQTVPPICFVKARVEGVPEAFVDFLIAESLVEIGFDFPEQFIGFFGEEYPRLALATGLGPNATYQIATALFAGWRGLFTREVFAEWENEEPALYEAWVDAGERLEGRVGELPSLVARNELDFAEATELACSAIKHDLDLPAPFGALDTEAYREHGPAFALRWAEKTFDALE